MQNKLHFILKEDGNLYVMQEVPEEPEIPFNLMYSSKREDYLEALKRAKDNAVLVDNKEEVIKRHWQNWYNNASDFESYTAMIKGQIYSLEGCKMVIKEKYDCQSEPDGYCWNDCHCPKSKLATITFSEAAQPEETQEELKKLKEWIASDSVYTLLRYGWKSPSGSGVDDCEDDFYRDLYNLSCELRKLNTP